MSWGRYRGEWALQEQCRNCFPELSVISDGDDAFRKVIPLHDGVWYSRAEICEEQICRAILQVLSNLGKVRLAGSKTAWLRVGVSNTL